MIAIDLIDVPPGRDIDEGNVEALARSLTLDGQLHEIGIRHYTDEEIAADPARGGRCELTYGRHRLAAAKSLGWEKIDAHANIGGEGTPQSAIDAENLFRLALTPAGRIVALKRWQEVYDAAYPDASGREVGARAATAARVHAVDPEGSATVVHNAPLYDEGPESPPQSDTSEKVTPIKRASSGSPKTFQKHAAAATGRSRSSVGRDLKAADALTPEQLAVLDERKVSRVHILAIGKLPEDERSRAVAMIAGGMNPVEAIQRAGYPEGAIITVHVAGDRNIEEDELSDEAWLEQYCGEVLARLKYTLVFKADALLYRKTRAIRQTLRSASIKPLGGVKGAACGWFHYLYSQFVNVEHPKSWLPCGPCEGSGMTARGKCSICHGNAYLGGSSRRKAAGR